jgi:hypothetical protein
MQVIAISTTREADWHWRIVTYDGEVVPESPGGVRSIADAVAAGNVWLTTMDGRATRT